MDSVGRGSLRPGYGFGSGHGLRSGRCRRLRSSLRPCRRFRRDLGLREKDRLGARGGRPREVHLECSIREALPNQTARSNRPTQQRVLTNSHPLRLTSEFRHIGSRPSVLPSYLRRHTVTGAIGRRQVAATRVSRWEVRVRAASAGVALARDLQHCSVLHRCMVEELVSEHVGVGG